MSSNRSEAAASDERDTTPLRLDPAARLFVVRARDELLLAGPNLERERSLTRLRKQLVRIEPVTDLTPEPESVEPAGRKHHGVEPALAALAQARVDVPPERLDREGRLERQELRPPADGRRSDPHPGTKTLGTAERVAGILAQRIGANGKAFGIRRGHVLGGVDGHVDPAREQRLLELLDEDAALADLPERLRPVTVARGRDRDERDLDPASTTRGAAQRLGGTLRLGEREPTAARPDADEHSGGGYSASTRRTRGRWSA